ncbi:tyrosine kinase, putative, partial [Entamoeba invadens IP1]
NCSSYVNQKCVECNEKYYMNIDKNCVKMTENPIDNCIKMGIWGCLICEPGYYIDGNKCVKCDEICTSCVSKSSLCLSCQSGFYLGVNNTCISNDLLKDKCKKISTITSGCYECKDTYFRVGLDCVRCLTNCTTCNTASMCLTCNETNFKTVGGDCLPQNIIVGCQVEVTQNGCNKCLSGYYSVNFNECKKCDDNCKTCYLVGNKCTSCNENNILDENNKCVSLSKVPNCNQIKNSKCSKCTFWHTPSVNGTSCVSKAVWWIILIIVTFCLLMIVLVTTTFVFLFNLIQNKQRKNELEKTTTVFSIEKSNIHFISIGNGIVVNTTDIIFNDGEEANVNEKLRELLCVGNTTKHNMKIQISNKTSENSKFIFESNPQLIFLGKGEACEFEIFVTLLCTSKIQSEFLLISNSLDKEKEIYKEIKFSLTSKITTRIDPDELKEEKKLGEGSFGIVFKGTFRENNVAIKKMKQQCNNTNGMIEFESEVSMLDKFRSDYIVHFYGAVFIPNKICLVTEFALLGSLQDLIKHKQSNEIEMKLKIKIMLDASKGIQYLHENGILHRDIKPDNILVISTDLNEKVNSKLTDFGSARNVNMLMTNMTFTRGIGTPKYMAPEILNREKYTKSADIYSLAITILECFTWEDPFPKTIFCYAWSVADHISTGKRPESISMLNKTYRNVIENAWKQQPKERSDINTIMNELSFMY